MWKCVHGMFEKAITDFDEAIRLQPNSADPYLGRSFAYSALGRNEESSNDFIAAVQMMILSGEDEEQFSILT